MCDSIAVTADIPGTHISALLAVTSRLAPGAVIQLPSCTLGLGAALPPIGRDISFLQLNICIKISFLIFVSKKKNCHIIFLFKFKKLLLQFSTEFRNTYKTTIIPDK